MLVLSNVLVEFGGLKAVDNVSLKVAPAEIRGLIGPNGAGKTTLFNAISGLVPTSSGTLSLGGVDFTHKPAHVRAACGIRRTFQSIQLAQTLTVLENVALGLQVEAKENLIKTIFGMNARSSVDWSVQQKVYDVLEDLGIADLALARVDSLTFSQQRHVEIARSLVARPTLLMFDEPAAGLTPAGIEELDKLIVRIRNERGIAILLVEHVMSLVLNVCDSVTVLDNGRIIAEGSPEHISTDARVQTAYLGALDDAAS